MTESRLLEMLQQLSYSNLKRISPSAFSEIANQILQRNSSLLELVQNLTYRDVAQVAAGSIVVDLGQGHKNRGEMVENVADWAKNGA